jgi:membrane peptidoglycan carboxypeptidase
VATFAAGGLRATAHFVKKVTKGDDKNVLYGETLPNPNQGRVLNQQQVTDLTYALSQVAPGINIQGFQAATKTGTWEYNQRVDQNAHAWNVGFTTKLAAAVWVGNKKEEQALLDKNRGTVWGSGLPRSTWVKFMNDATKAMGLPKDKTQFAPPVYIGDENPAGSIPSPTPVAHPVANAGVDYAARHAKPVP